MPPSASPSDTYLESSYAGLAPGYPPLARFQREICDTLARYGLSTEHSVLDIGCGRGYLLRELAHRGHHSLLGLDPCRALVRLAVSPHVRSGGFFEPDIAECSFDVVICCHTLHHLKPSFPLKEIEWAKERARRWVVVVEVNNTNLPTWGMGLLKKRTEPHVCFYNLHRTKMLLEKAGLNIIHSDYMRCGYLSGDSLPYRIAAIIGTKPYCLVMGSVG